MKLVLTLAASAALAMTASTAPLAGNPSVHGNIVRTGGTAMKIDVVVLKDGRVNGSMISVSPSGFIYTVDYDRVTFSADGKSAYLHGVVTYANNNPALVGHPSIQKVTDNGEGAKAAPDMSSPVVNPASLPTNYEAYIDGFTPAPIIEGNIQVLAH